jgi:hypothetical protein
MVNQLTGDDEKQSRPAKHFEDRYWIDFVRGLKQGDNAIEMQRHLNAGCEVCGRDRDLWLSLFDMGRNGGLYEPSKEIIQQVKGLFIKRESVQLFPGELRWFGIFRVQAGMFR